MHKNYEEHVSCSTHPMFWINCPDCEKANSNFCPGCKGTPTATKPVDNEKVCVTCKHPFHVDGRFLEAPSICRECWNFARAEFHRYRLLIGDLSQSHYPMKGGCIIGTCSYCD